MSYDLQGITFGFFEDLSQDLKDQVAEILYGEKGVHARPELPWFGEDSEVTAPEVSPIPEQRLATPGEASRDHQEQTGEPSDDVPQKTFEEPEPEVIPAADLDSKSSPAPHITHSDILPLSTPPGIQPPGIPPPGIQPPMYPHSAIPVVTGLPPHVLTYMGVYPQPGMGTMPISYMPVMSPQGVGLSQCQQVTSYTTAPPTFSNPGHHEQMMMHMEEPEKEKNKILGGKVYERRNKKRRPVDYYNRFDPKPMTMEEMMMAHGGLQNANQHMQMHTMMPPGHAVPMTYQGPMMQVGPGLMSMPHSSPGHLHNLPPHAYPPPALGHGPITSSHVVMATHPPPATWESSTPSFQQCPDSQLSEREHSEASTLYLTDSSPIPPLQSDHMSTLTSSAESENQPSQESSQDVSVPNQTDIASASPAACPKELATHTTSQYDVDPTAASSFKPQNHHSQQNASIATEIYTDDGSRTIDSSEITFGEVNIELTKIARGQPNKSSLTESPSLQPADKQGVVLSDNNNTVMKDMEASDNVEGNVPSQKSPQLLEETADIRPPSPSPSPMEPTGGEEAEPCSQGDSNTMNSEPQDSQSALASPPPSAAPPPPKPTTPPPPKPTTWAGLFKGTSTAESATVIYPNYAIIGKKDEPVPSGGGSSNNIGSVGKETENSELPQTVTVDKDTAAQQIGTLLKEYSLNYAPTALQPRGLINRGNWCYVNATLQALLACVPFYNLLVYVPLYAQSFRGPSSTPILDSIVAFVNEFSLLPDKSTEKNNKPVGKGNIKMDIATGPQFEVDYVYKMLQVIKYDGFKHGRQEDAEEFLSCVLNGLHEEMVATLKLIDGGSDKASITSVEEEVELTTNGDADLSEELSPDGENGWEQVGPKNKIVITHSAKFDTSPISEIFRGQTRNILSRPRTKESATLQPFFTIQLDIQAETVLTVQDALEKLVSKETLQGFTCSSTKQEVDASRRTMLEELPPVLILHLKCFIYDKSGGCQKLVKEVNFSNELEISRELLSPNTRHKYPQQQRKYKLFAVVKHHGARAAGGHYTTDIFNQAIGEWIHHDDGHVFTVTMSQVFKFRPPKVPYLLYYRRTDLS